MKKAIKGIIILIVVLIIIIFIFISFIFWLFHNREYHIKTKYQDSFTIIGGGFTNDYIMFDDNSNYIANLALFSKQDLSAVYDSEYFRCYRFLNKEDDLYIIQIKKYNHFIPLYNNNKEYTVYSFENNRKAIIIKPEFLCDPYLMELVLPYFDELYHDEMITVAENMIEEDYENLYEYGLTKDMINDKESLNEKIRIMKQYLKSYNLQ